MIDLDDLTPGKYVIGKDRQSFVALPPKPKKKKKLRAHTEFEKTLAIRKDFRRGMSYRQLAKRHRTSLSSVRGALRGDMYISMIAEAEKLEPTLEAVCLVGLLTEYEVPNARAGLDAWYNRGGTDTRAIREQKRALKRLNPGKRGRPRKNVADKST